MMWLPFSRNISAMPLIIRLSDSVAPLVKIISFGVALISQAICCRDVSTASSPAQPKERLRLRATAAVPAEDCSRSLTPLGAHHVDRVLELVIGSIAVIARFAHLTITRYRP